MNATTSQVLYFLFMWILLSTAIIIARVFKKVFGFVLILIVAAVITLILWLIYYYGKLCSPKYSCSEFYTKIPEKSENTIKNKNELCTAKNLQ